MSAQPAESLPLAAHPSPPEPARSAAPPRAAVAPPPSSAAQQAELVWTRIRRLSEHLMALRRERRQLTQALGIERTETARLRAQLESQSRRVGELEAELTARPAEATGWSADHRSRLAGRLEGVLTRVEGQLVQLDVG